MTGRAVCQCGDHGIRVDDPGYRFPYCGVCGKNWPVPRVVPAVVVEVPPTAELPPATALEADVLGDE